MARASLWEKRLSVVLHDIYQNGKRRAFGSIKTQRNSRIVTENTEFCMVWLLSTDVASEVAFFDPRLTSWIVL